ncbi:MAG: hypothetical protein NT028_11630, partial [candidate division Zixibacteria bacterium]|nr:hypothetical protein [candidate division Zixibacteria bacterium]
TLSLVAGIIAILLYVPLCVQVLSGKVKQNFATWVLWATLDGIVAATIIFQGGSFLLPAAYSLGSAAVTLSILKSKNFKWTWFETMVACLVVACVVVWVVSGAKVATVASTLAVMIAGVPQSIEAYKKPHEQPFLIYVGFLVANSLATAGAKNWSIEERFYPASMTLLTIAVVLFIARKLWSKIVLFVSRMFGPKSRSA